VNRPPIWLGTGRGSSPSAAGCWLPTPRFSLRGAQVTVDVDLQALVQDRMRQSSFGANAGDHAARRFRTVDCSAAAESRPIEVFAELRRPAEPLPFVPADPAKRDGAAARCS
jgi:hypothetical protein